MPFQWRNQIWQSLEEGAGKRCPECGTYRDRSLAANGFVSQRLGEEVELAQHVACGDVVHYGHVVDLAHPPLQLINNHNNNNDNNDSYSDCDSPRKSYSDGRKRNTILFRFLVLFNNQYKLEVNIKQYTLL